MRSLLLALCIVFSAATAQAADTCDEQPVAMVPGVFAGVATAIATMGISPLLAPIGLPVFALSELAFGEETLTPEAYFVLLGGSALIFGTYAFGAFLTYIPMYPLTFVYGLGFFLWLGGYVIPAQFAHAAAQTAWFALVAPKMAQTERCKISRKK